MKQNKETTKSKCGWWCKHCQKFKAENRINSDMVCLDCYSGVVTWERKGDKECVQYST